MTISRRTVLRGAGVALALPWLESLPAIASPSTPRRLAVLFMGNGISGNHWWAAGSGAAMTLGRSLAPLAPLKSKINVVNGLFNQAAVGRGIHPAQTGNVLSGVPLATDVDAGAGITIDQLLADRVGHETALASLTLSCEAPLDGCHESGFPLAYSSHISWRRTAAAPCDVQPADAFARLFEARERTAGASVIDRVLDGTRRVARTVSAGDTARLDEYLTTVREIETRIDQAALKGCPTTTAALKGCPTTTAALKGCPTTTAALKGCPTTTAALKGCPTTVVGRAFRPAEPHDLREHARLMCDIVALAFQTDRTRIASLVLARDLSSLTYPFLDVAGDHHAASHDDLSDGYERIVRFHVAQLASLAAKLDAMPEGDGTVLDHSCLLWLSNMWSGWKHDNMKLPIVTVGGLGGTLATGRSLDYMHRGDDGRRLCSLYLSLMDRLGVRLARFGDADTRLADF